MSRRSDTWIFLAAAALAILASAWVNGLMDSRFPHPAELPAGPAAVSEVTPGEAKKLLAAGGNVVLLDVRTPEEHEERHIPGGLLLPLDEPAIFGPKAEKLLPDRDAAILVYCRSGRRSRLAAEILAGLGYRNVRDLGGIIDWPYETAGGK